MSRRRIQDRARGGRSPRALLLCLHAGGLAALLACAPGDAWVLRGTEESPRAFRVADFNRGPEPYSAWFGDSDGRILYFGASPFWTLWWETGGDATADLREPGDHLIGRFDMEAERFLSPLRVRERDSGTRGSVWDVLVHSNGRIYYTTYFEEIGSVSPDGTDVRHFPGVGTGFNELVEGPGGRVYLTRYAPSPQEGRRSGSVVVLGPDGALLDEFPIDGGETVVAAPKSLAVDPVGGAIWLNADLFFEDGSHAYAAFELSPEGRPRTRVSPPPELHFVAFAPDGTGWFAESTGEELQLRVTRGGHDVARTSLGRPRGIDFVQDIKPFGPGRAVLGLWSGRAFVASVDGAFLTAAEVRFVRPADCEPPHGRSLLYTAVPYGGYVFASLDCGWTILRAPLPGG